jgi:FkbM family methyltransferase
MRLIARILPLKYKLNGLIRKYLNCKGKLIIPYINGYSIVVEPDDVAESTISNLIFEGATYLPEYELLQSLIKSLPKNFTAIDVGANIGTVVWQLAQKAGRLYAFEPMPQLAAIINDSAAYNQFTKLHLYTKAAGSKAGFVQMVDNENSSVINSTCDEIGVTIEVTTLDMEFSDYDRIDFIKVDVEGFEWEVLQGAVDILKKHRPILLIELHTFFLKNFNVDYKTVIDFLEQKGYEISYYSFLEETRMGRLTRLLSRYLPSKGKKFNSKDAFIKDVETIPYKMVYHIYCKPVDISL